MDGLSACVLGESEKTVRPLSRSRRVAAEKNKTPLVCLIALVRLAALIKDANYVNFHRSRCDKQLGRRKQIVQSCKTNQVKVK